MGWAGLEAAPALSLAVFEWHSKASQGRLPVDSGCGQGHLQAPESRQWGRGRGVGEALRETSRGFPEISPEQYRQPPNLP